MNILNRHNIPPFLILVTMMVFRYQIEITMIINTFWLLNTNIHDSQVGAEQFLYVGMSFRVWLNLLHHSSQHCWWMLRIEPSLTVAMVALQNKQLHNQVWIDENDSYSTSALKSIDLVLLFTLALQYFSKLSHVWVEQKRKISFASKQTRDFYPCWDYAINNATTQF